MTPLSRRGAARAPHAILVAVLAIVALLQGLGTYRRITFWYGAVTDANLAVLKTYDIVVLEPTLRVVNVAKNEFYLETLTVNQIRELQAGRDGLLNSADDVITLAYISVGEMLATIIPGSSGHMTIQKGIELGLLPAGYSGPSGPVHGPNPWNFSAAGGYLNVEGGASPDGTYDDAYGGWQQVGIAQDYSSWGSRLSWTNRGFMPWYMDQQGATADWISDSRYLYGGYWKKGDGTIDANKYYGGGYINAGDPAWQKFVTFQVDKLVHDIGFDGVFLDTVDTPDPVGGAGPSVSWGPRGNFGWTAPGMVDLVEKIKAVDPTKVVSANRGYWYFNPDEGTSQYAARYRHAINMFVTETWYWNIWGNVFFDSPPSGNWVTSSSAPDYRTRDNFGGFWKEYVNAQANQADGFNVVIIDFQVPASGVDKWHNEVIGNSDYLGYDVAGASNFNMAIYTQTRDWLASHGYAEASLPGIHPNRHNGFRADGDMSEWNAEVPIYSDPTGTNAKGITKVYVKFVNDQFFLMVETKAVASWPGDSIYFDYDQDGPSGWNVFWPVSPDARIFLENARKTYLVPHDGSGTGETFKFTSPNAPTNNGWPVNTAQNGTRFELEFERGHIFKSNLVGREIWMFFRAANLGGSSIKFTVPPLGGTSPTATQGAPTATRTRTNTMGTGGTTPVVTATRTRTNTTGTGLTATRTRTNTMGTGPTATRTRTPTGPSGATPTPAPGGIAIDGSFADWTGSAAFGSDPNDAGGGSSDAKAIYLTSGGGSLSLRADVWGTYSPGIVNILYIDTDASVATGYSPGWTAIGADYRIVHTSAGFATPTLQVHAGAAGADTWTTVRTISGAYGGSSAEFAVPYAAFSPALAPGNGVAALFRASQDGAPDFWSPRPAPYTLR
jgi:hypothetical protein